MHLSLKDDFASCKEIWEIRRKRFQLLTWTFDYEIFFHRIKNKKFLTLPALNLQFTHFSKTPLNCEILNTGELFLSILAQNGNLKWESRIEESLNEVEIESRVHIRFHSDAYVIRLETKCQTYSNRRDCYALSLL